MKNKDNSSNKIFKKNKILLVDHHDSFSGNLKAALECCHFEVQILQSENLQPDSWLDSQHWQAVVFSPGTGTPAQYPKSLLFLKQIPAHVPVLGVCLGHQLLLFADGARVSQTNPVPVHGRQVFLNSYNCRPHSRWLGEGALADSFVLYNSLGVQCHDPVFVDPWDVLASDNPSAFVLAAEHRLLPRVGVQFHPESFASTGGKRFLQAFAQFVDALGKS